MTLEQPLVVRVTHRYSASAERVFDAWLDAEFAAKWLFATSGGQMIRAEIDARAGGTFTFVDRREGEDVLHTGTYLEIDRPRRLVFTFGIPAFSANLDRVTIEIAPLDSGCELTLTHEMKPEFGEYLERTQQGWTKILAALDEQLRQDVLRATHSR
jgi:uncharacterized protein YndB with AHSA1/START domain